MHPSLFTDKNQKLTPNQFTRQNNIYFRDAQSGGLTPFQWILSILYQETGRIKNNWLLFFTRFNNKPCFVDLMTGSSSSVNASGSNFPTILSSLCSKKNLASRIVRTNFCINTSVSEQKIKVSLNLRGGGKN